MKNILTLLTVSILFFNCVNKTPSLNEEEYKKKQIEYEALKERLNGNKAVFFDENKDTIMKKIALFKKLKDTITEFPDVNIDSLFFLKNVSLNAVNNNRSRSYNERFGNRIDGEKAVFLSKRENLSYRES